MASGEQPAEYTIYEGHPSWRGILSFYIKGMVLALVAGVIAYLISGVALGAGIFAAIFVVLLLAGLIRRLGTTYTVTSRRLRIRQGLLRKDTRETRLMRVQNVNTHQTLVDRAATHRRRLHGKTGRVEDPRDLVGGHALVKQVGLEAVRDDDDPAR